MCYWHWTGNSKDSLSQVIDWSSLRLLSLMTVAGHGANLALADWNELEAASLLEELDSKECVSKYIVRSLEFCE